LWKSLSVARFEYTPIPSSHQQNHPNPRTITTKADLTQSVILTLSTARHALIPPIHPNPERKLGDSISNHNNESSTQQPTQCRP
jgi:hypothetical protein